jgi:hypothetical protein
MSRMYVVVRLCAGDSGSLGADRDLPLECPARVICGGRPPLTGLNAWQKKGKIEAYDPRGQG